ncbi:hypothetical protein [Vibrio mangrovi]|uniref:Uncharacterized protein n=1 Tax=Vibrio mangrovi TaxID=474394 RepID=A0A1Y6ISX0_9VIBR|nr:hypothetical protein [Vibrio mangrovi]MDW6004443.1 hypothetical protein [Vibrio mangrovi]MDW6004457.1 hypothetical protein [Vibrio mangrovi]SMS00745.1 hypothetical protein VIM7927_02014 [Vibrio mangrovi]
MALCVEQGEQGYLYISGSAINECSSLVVLTVDEYKANTVQLNPSEISSLFFFAFGLVLVSYKISWVVGVMKNLIGKI